MRARNLELIKPPTAEDFRKGADRLHEIFDGKIVLPDKLCVVVISVAAAVAPYLIGFLLYGWTI